MRALLQPEVFTLVIPSDIHQLDGVQRAPGPPGRAGGMRAFSYEGILDGDQATPRCRSIGGAHIVAHVGEDHEIHAFEESSPHEISLCHELFLSNAGPEPQGAWH